MQGTIQMPINFDGSRGPWWTRDVIRALLVSFALQQRVFKAARNRASPVREMAGEAGPVSPAS
jgi:hypothetical protein